jgi:hypothetical protein
MIVRIGSNQRSDRLHFTVLSIRLPVGLAFLTIKLRHQTHLESDQQETLKAPTHIHFVAQQPFVYRFIECAVPNHGHDSPAPDDLVVSNHAAAMAREQFI